MYVQCTCARPEKLQTAKLAKPLLAIATEHHRCGAESSSLAQVTENSLREVFHSCGQLDEVIFRSPAGIDSSWRFLVKWEEPATELFDIYEQPTTELFEQTFPARKNW